MPVFGVEKYIEKCLSSLLVSNSYNYEIILVNDGTKDRSMDIVREKFCDSRIRIFEQENRGLSAARNYGINEAKGEYVWMFDSDDWAETTKLKSVIDQLDNVDMLYFNNIYINYDKDCSESVFSSKAVANTGLELAHCNYHFPAQFYIFRKKILLDSQHYFKEGILHEDLLFTPIAILLSSKVKCFETPVYHYRQREGSITKVVNPKRIFDMIYVINSLVEFGKKNLSQKIRYKWGRCIVQSLNGVLYISQSCADKATLLQLKKFVNKNWEVYRYLIHSNTKNKLMGILSFATFGNLYQLYKVIYRLRKK